MEVVVVVMVVVAVDVAVAATAGAGRWGAPAMLLQQSDGCRCRGCVAACFSF